MSRITLAHTTLVRASLTLALASSTLAHATNGYLPHGYGTQSKGSAGAGVAMAQDTLAAATNPAGLIDLGNRLDVGIEIFSPDRSSSIVGNAFGPDQTFDGNSTRVFYIPEFGYSRVVSPNLSIGLSIYGNGGMNTDYSSNPYARFGATGPAGIDLAQVFVTPALAWRFAEGQSLGVAVNLAYQQFEARGISLFSGFSQDPSHVSDNGYDSSTGAGFRVGWQGSFGDHVTLGASWQSKTQMNEFEKYSGMFADNGDFDVPENYSVGIAIKATPALTLLIDRQRILYGNVPAVGNSAALLFAGQPLGSKNGPGFGWKDTTVTKIGVVYQATSALTLRAGFSDVDQPIPAEETFFNILAPGVVEKHYTLGATYDVSEKNAFSVYVAHMPEVSVTGNNSIPPGMPPGGFGGGNANLRMQENAIGFAWQRKL